MRQSMQMLSTETIVIVGASEMSVLQSVTSLRPIVDKSLSYNCVNYYLFAIPSLFIFLVYVRNSIFKHCSHYSTSQAIQEGLYDISGYPHTF